MDQSIKLPHIKFKPTIKQKIDFHPSELNKITVPEESKMRAKKYQKSNELNDGSVILMFEDNIVFGFDFLYNNEKYMVQEINPATIFYSNAVMCHRLLVSKRNQLISGSPKVKGSALENTNPSDFANFFQVSVNMIINLQATVESFANRLIPTDFEFLDANGNEFQPSISHKINTALPLLKGKKVKRKESNYLRQLIEIRNELIHLKPAGDVNSAYKIVYRKLINFKYFEVLQAVKTFVNFYEEGLIEECSCKKEFFYDISVVE
ncbi:hypothetical protein [Flavobacterium johnsoniae]|uniref:Uncharacterized protein n=1 Tax=Flavobacterium johnsoniae (strain ATCC 17061 / DSM 2064 / JCM 8514 / BCRC 14874 / CCUG 350202 / NBRC 14942 / NCIMB 11054 / UW101) TaxID=376686 RepID=A5FDK9_FLAJ1|nr:hypothetical protein [Flavobacterium johnsoniae]ABQ06704.1 hypothetical protein Fjoh_3690 [Flavobacterium johnsoniae UW101]OXE95268.1 hypothetical protein B0A63_25185 [Flavobacterium johnsoniae UW101]WQG82461.1 hypothetical protein SR927_04940 [Flavobacterium johnsoniae UW101]SHM01989.1 hypothetical protein SAMN05444146_5199 [Flavobacterium johnsoniae]